MKYAKKCTHVASFKKKLHHTNQLIAFNHQSNEYAHYDLLAHFPHVCALFVNLCQCQV